MSSVLTSALPQSAAQATDSDESLFLRFQESRSREDFEALVQRFQRFVYHTTLCFCKNTAQAEDITQNIFLHLSQSKTQFKDYGPGSFKGWLFRLISNHARNTSRGDRRRIMRESVKRRDSDLISLEHEPSQRQEHKELLDTLRQALFELSEDVRTLIVLRYTHGLSQHEIGNMMGLSQSSVSHRIEEGLAKIKKKMAGEGAVLPAFGLPMLLMDSDFLSVPQGLTSKLYQAWGSMGAHGAVSARMVGGGYAAKTSLSVALGWLSGVAAAFFAWSVFQAPATKTRPAAMPIAMLPAAALPVQAEKISKTYDFNTKDQASDFKPLTGTWHFAPNRGLNGTGCMETDEINSMIEVTSAAQLKYPLRIKLRVHIIPPEPGRTFTVVAARRFQQSVLFHNLGSIRVLRGKYIPWQQVEIFMNEHSNDVWVDGQRVSLELNEGAHGPPILYIVGRYHLDDLTIEEINSNELPDIHMFVNALEKIPKEKRVGRIEVNDLSSGRSGKKVELNFCTQAE